MDEGQQVQEQNLVNDQVTQALADSGVADDSAAATPAPATPAVPETPAPATPTVPTTPVEAPDDDTPLTGTAEATPLTGETVTAPMIDTPGEEPEEEEEAPEVAPAAVSVPSPASSGDDDLLSVKQKALEQLSPLVDHLNLPPDQKFDTYMEILRASDDKTLIQPAFDEAQKIDDEDRKAQALLDVVNEVNYLTQDETDQAAA